MPTLLVRPHTQPHAHTYTHTHTHIHTHKHSHTQSHTHTHTNTHTHKHTHTQTHTHTEITHARETYFLDMLLFWEKSGMLFSDLPIELTLNLKKILYTSFFSTQSEYT
jgi:hypothetical protein